MEAVNYTHSNKFWYVSHILHVASTFFSCTDIQVKIGIQGIIKMSQNSHSLHTRHKETNLCKCSSIWHLIRLNICSCISKPLEALKREWRDERIVTKMGRQYWTTGELFAEEIMSQSQKPSCQKDWGKTIQTSWLKSYLQEERGQF